MSSFYELNTKLGDQIKVEKHSEGGITIVTTVYLPVSEQFTCLQLAEHEALLLGKHLISLTKIRRNKIGTI